MLKARNELESWARECVPRQQLIRSSARFHPLRYDARRSPRRDWERLTVGPPFFNKWMTPVGLTLLLLTGIGPLLAWRKTTLSNLVQQFLWPTVVAVVTGGAMVALGVSVWSSGICFALCGFVFGTVAQEYVRGTNVRKATSGADFFTAMIGLVGRNQRRYGGYIVHLGIVLIFLGFAGAGMSYDEQIMLKPNEQATVGDYTLRLDALRVTDDGQKQMITGHLTVGSQRTRDRQAARPNGSSAS
jgi:cytochrome c-type biogenesis protein CcmF